MAARFSQPPTLGEVIKVAKKYGFRLGTTPGLVGPRGPARIRYLVRGDIHVDLADLRDGHRLTENSLRYISHRTGIPLEDFGVKEMPE
jgi:hypothetical protein